MPNLDEMESGVGELPFLLLLLLPPLPEGPEVDAEEEEPLGLSSLGLLDNDELWLVLELEDFKEELFWFPEFEPKGLEAPEISFLCSQYLWSICWERAQRSMILSTLP